MVKAARPRAIAAPGWGHGRSIPEMGGMRPAAAPGAAGWRTCLCLHRSAPVRYGPCRAPAGGEGMEIRTVGIVGAGTMGGGIATNLAAHGFAVLLADSRPEAAAAAL